MNLRSDIGPGAWPLPSLRWQFAAWRLGVRLPEAWRRTPRRRRFLFLGLCAPGFLTVAALPLHHNLWALLLGLAGIGLAYAIRRLSEPLFLTTGEGNAKVQDLQA
jgi:hypothetical protein